MTYDFLIDSYDTERVKVISVWSEDRKSTRLNSSHSSISYAVFCLKKKTTLPQVLLNYTHLDLAVHVVTPPDGRERLLVGAVPVRVGAGLSFQLRSGVAPERRSHPL